MPRPLKNKAKNSRPAMAIRSCAWGEKKALLAEKSGKKGASG